MFATSLGGDKGKTFTVLVGCVLDRHTQKLDTIKHSHTFLACVTMYKKCVESTHSDLIDFVELGKMFDFKNWLSPM